MPEGRFGIDPAAVQTAIAGHEQIVNTLAAVVPDGRDLAAGGSAYGLASLVESADLGDHGLEAVFAEFCMQWTHGLGMLLRAGQALADELREVVGGYRGTEDEVSGFFKELYASLVSPDADKAAQAGDMSWMELMQATGPEGRTSIEDGVQEGTQAYGSLLSDVGGALGSLGAGAAEPWRGL